jgi:hypothetical protein
VSTPDISQQLDVSEVAAELERDSTSTLGSALWQKAQLSVIVRKQAAQLEILRDRVEELTKQREEPKKPGESK